MNRSDTTESAQRPMSARTEHMETRLQRPPFLSLLTLLALCLLLWWPAFSGPFVFDDEPNLSALGHVASVESWRDLGIYLSEAREFPGRPLAMLSFLPQKAAWPSDPFSFKLVNALLHLLCACLVFLFCRTLARTAFASNDDTNWNTGDGIALLTVAAWLLHPMQLSATMLVIQRMTVLMAIFVLVGLGCYLQCLIREDRPLRERGLWLLAGLAICPVLAILCKENGILLPFYALVIDSTLLRERSSRLPYVLSLLRRAFIWVPIAFVAVYLIWVATNAQSAYFNREFNLEQRLLTEPRILFDYLGKIFLPRFGIYSVYNDSFPLSSDWLHPWTTPVALAVILAFLALAIVYRKTYPLASFAVLWFLVGHVLESTVIPLELYFEHRNYVPMIGPIFAASAATLRLVSPTTKRVALAAWTIGLFSCVLSTALSARIWANTDRIFAAWASADAHSIRAQVSFAGQLAVHHRLSDALSVINRIHAEYPQSAQLSMIDINLRCRLGQLSDTDVDALERILLSTGFDRGAFENLEPLRILAAQRTCAPVLTIEKWRRWTNLMLNNPHFGNDQVAAGIIHYQRHLAYLSEGNLDGVMRELNATWASDPDPEIPRLQAKYLVDAGLKNDAIEILSNVDYSKLPLLRRALVNDGAINQESIAAIRALP